MNMKPLVGAFTIVLIVVLLAVAAQSALTRLDSRTPATTSPRLPEAVTEQAQASDIIDLLPSETPPAGASSEFKTNFSRHTVPYKEILSGGPPKDGIPAIDNPMFVDVASADAWLGSQEPVLFAQIGDDARAYPLQILTWHEIVNDAIGGVPVIVTFCPLCNTAIVFERAVQGRVLEFGTTGRLRYSNLIMYDRQTETWWQQAEGEAIAGELTGARLAARPASIISWSAFKTAYPQGKVLSRETGYSRPYGANPYTGYDNINQQPFLYQGPTTPGKLPPMERVVTVDLNGEAVAYPYSVLRSVGVVNDTVGAASVVVFWTRGTASALDAASVAEGRDIGSTAVYYAEVDSQRLTFRKEGDRFIDNETGSQWDAFGLSVSGRFSGKRLQPVVHLDPFWFTWAAFKPETRVFVP